MPVKDTDTGGDSVSVRSNRNVFVDALLAEVYQRGVYSWVKNILLLCSSISRTVL